ncbi:MAG: UPF0179 family protein [Candidatus Thermoplasmatota archaeon]|jgi:uncharacterized protein (UPF0179 family)|nr:UPF0179 family protein [Candidatus Thermoplasmatota archaeon]
MAKVSLIGVDLAEEGMEFTFVQPLKECSECKVKNVCFNLEQGRNYRVTAVRKKEIPCNVYNKGKVMAIEVEELEESVHVKYGQKVQDGSSFVLESLNCDNFSCEHIETCNLMHVRNGRKVTIASVEEKIECPKNYDIRRVKVA